MVLGESPYLESEGNFRLKYLAPDLPSWEDSVEHHHAHRHDHAHGHDGDHAPRR